MFEKIGKLMKAIAVLNAAGMDMLVNMANDVASHEKYRKADSELTPMQFDMQVKQVLDMVESGRLREECACI